ncbi:MAG: Druantia anti-phage system protein DruA [Nitrososphaera sp.]
MSHPPVPAPIYFSGRTFSIREVQLIQEITADFSALGLTEISRTVCELLEWHRPNGGLKNHECRQFLERLSELCLVKLPAVRRLGPRGPRVVSITARSEPEPELTGSAGQFEPLWLEIVESGSREKSRLWMELVERYHYLGYRVPVGANLRYLVRSAHWPERVLACLMWSSPAWKIAVRDRWIGWSNEQRRHNLQLIVSNARFLILPWVHIRGLASKILSRCAHQLADDWKKHYGYRPLLLETLVDSARFRGTCYRAANWIFLGRTQGRGRMDRDCVAQGRAVKDVYVYPLWREVREHLRADPAPVFSEE